MNRPKSVSSFNKDTKMGQPPQIDDILLWNIFKWEAMIIYCYESFDTYRGYNGEGPL